MNWRGQPLISYETVIKLIGATTTSKGLTVAARLDEGEYKSGVKISEGDIAQLQIQPHSLNPKWNYTLSSRDVHPLK
ncbi:rhodopirellula transposase [archaeon]|nr:rhodopirellula transposase [archaeon]